MLLNKSLLLISFLCLLSISYGQENYTYEDLDIVTGEREKFEAVSRFIANDETGYWMLRRHKPTSVFIKYPRYWLEHYDRKLNSKKLEKIDIGDSKLEEIFEFNQQLYLVSSKVYSNKQEKSYFVQKINKKNLTLDSKRKKLFSIDLSGDKRRVPKASFEYAADKKGLFIYHLELDVKARYNPLVRFRFFDDQFNLKWESQSKQKACFGEYKNYFDRVAIANDRSIYFLGTGSRTIEVKKLLKKEVTKEPFKRFGIFKLSNSGTQIDSMFLELGAYEMDSGKLLFNEDGTLTLVGNLSKGVISEIYGTFVCQIDFENRKVSEINYHLYEEKIILDNLEKRARARRVRKLEKEEDCPVVNYTIDKLFRNEKQEIFQINEQQYISYTVGSGGSASSTKRTYYYHYADLIITKYTKEGKHLWTSKIPKRVRIDNITNGEVPYAFKRIKDQLYFIFSDSRKNIDYDGVGSMPNSNYRPRVAVVKVDEQGGFTKRWLFDKKKKRQIFYGGQVDISDTEIILQTGFFKSKYLTKIKFKE